MDMELFRHIDLTKLLQDLFTYNPTEPLLFPTGQFLFLFLAFFGIYILIEKKKSLRVTYVVLFSLFFYYKSSGFYFFLIILSTLIDYFIGLRLHESKTAGTRKLLLLLSMVANLGLLFYFKYTNFFLSIFDTLADRPHDPLSIFLPVGISFYTFQTMSYTIDIYRRKLEPVHNVMDFAFFVSFFPQLVAGPIVRASEFLPQIRRDIQVSLEQNGRAVMLICGGLFKKAVISDYIGVNFVDRIFEDPMRYTGFENLMAVYGYAMQIYCDFSGYSDIAIGIGLLLGFTLPINFNAPYKASSIQNFWRRWHISLSTWLRDYLYISLGGNRFGTLRTYFNLFLTMLLGGLWHGAAWRFVVWGAMHGAMLSLERLFRSGTASFNRYISQKMVQMDNWVIANWLESDDPKKVRKGQRYDKAGNRYWAFRESWKVIWKDVSSPLGILFTFHFVCLSWIFFRAASFDVALDMIRQIWYAFDASVIVSVLVAYQKVFWLMLLGYLLHFLPDRVEHLIEGEFVKAPLWAQSLTLAVVAWAIIQTYSAAAQPFIYFQF